MKSEVAFWSARRRAMRWRPSSDAVRRERALARSLEALVDEITVDEILEEQDGMAGAAADDGRPRRRGQRARRGAPAGRKGRPPSQPTPQATVRAARSEAMVVAVEPEAEDIEVPAFLRRQGSAARARRAAPAEADSLAMPEWMTDLLDRIDPVGGPESCFAMAMAGLVFILGSPIGGSAILVFALVIRLLRSR